MPVSPALIEFPADEPQRAREFWSGLLGTELSPRDGAQGEGWQSEREAGNAPASVGVHARGRGPGDTFSLPYFELDDMQAALAQVPSLGGSVVHAGERWSICKDTEGNPFGLALRVDDRASSIEQGAR
jgi:predicted enzyme related to lactoylglutathione lyase